MNALELRNVTKTYRDFTLDDIHFTLPTGAILGLIGENGAGKSTTIKLILDAIHRDSGEIYVLGRDNRIHFKETKEDIGIVLDEAYFPEGMTVKQVNQIMKHTYRNWNEETFEKLLKKFRLPEKKAFKDFSRGMKMKLAISVALSHDAKLLILDEATSGLDPIVRDEILDLFCEFTRDPQHSILISSHIISDLEKLCDYIAFIHEGKLLFCEEKDELLEQYVVVHGTEEQLSRLNSRALIGQRNMGYGIEALVKRADVPPNFESKQPGIEDIIVFMAREGSEQ